MFVDTVRPEILCRANNRFKARYDAIGTKDDEIVVRRWLPSPPPPKKKKRASGIPASDEEHNKAVAKADDIVTHLSRANFPDPIRLDSGNGLQLLYKIQASPAHAERSPYRKDPESVGRGIPAEPYPVKQII